MSFLLSILVSVVFLAFPIAGAYALTRKVERKLLATHIAWRRERNPRRERALYKLKQRQDKAHLWCILAGGFAGLIALWIAVAFFALIFH